MTFLYNFSQKKIEDKQTIFNAMVLYYSWKTNVKMIFIKFTMTVTIF